MSSMTTILVIAICFVQALYAGLSIISILALRQGMSHYTFVVYRMAIATALGSPLACPVLDQNLYYVGMENSNATFTSAMCNMLPVFAFVMAWIFRLENVDYRHPRGLAKVLGTLVYVVGAILLTMGQCTQVLPLQALSHALICFWGMVEGAVVAIVVERENSEAWSIHFDFKLLAAALLSGAVYYVMGLVVTKKGTVFYSAFNPLATLLVAILGSFFLAKQFLIGAVTIVGGLYLVLWGKARDQPPSLNANVEEPTGTPTIDD
ncbi:WAT1-related protein At2g39510 [Rosa chinensis]|uniref:WAT1-related protein At2g39510 n=1 Tax=Rosa chinensis TaxID=74649 RepID=UPI001AD90613|nr:WAT1-related protein At2g39510 [Rosa chinensis]